MVNENEEVGLLQQLPDLESVGLSVETLAKAHTAARLRPNCQFLFEVKTEELEVAKSGSIGIRLGLVPCDANGKAKRPMMNQTIYLPFENTAVNENGERRFPNHKAPDTLSQIVDYLQAEDEAFPRAPRFKKGSKGMYVMPDGSVKALTSAEALSARVQVEQFAAETMKDRMKLLAQGKPGGFKGQHVYATVLDKPADEQGRVFQQVSFFSAQPSTRTPLVTNPDEFLAPVEFSEQTLATIKGAI